MQAPFSRENEFWNQIIDKDADTIFAYMTEEPIIYLDGKKMNKDSFVCLLKGMKIKVFTLDHMEIVNCDENMIQVLYKTKMVVDGEGESCTKELSISNSWICLAGDYYSAAILIQNH